MPTFNDDVQSARSLNCEVALIQKNRGTGITSQR